MNNAHFGSCLCGSVQFKIEGDFESFYFCYCKYCQKDTGSLHAANVFSKSAILTWLAGDQGIKLYQLPSTLHAKCFCTNCGAALPNYDENLGLLAVPAGSLDSPLTLHPNAKIFVRSKADWACDPEGLPSFEGSPENI